MLELVRVNRMDACYIRPIALRGYGDVGVNGIKNPIEVYIACWTWGKYLGEEALAEGVDVCVSSWTRMAPNTLPALAKAGANYMNSQLIKMEAIANGYAEGIALDTAGYVSEGSGENIFVVRDGKIHTPPLGASVLPGITRDAILTLARELGIPVVETHHPARDAVHCRRSLLLRHRRGNHADPLHRPHHDRKGPPRTGHRDAAEGVLRNHQRDGAGPARMALAGSREAAGRSGVTRDAAQPNDHLPRDLPSRLRSRLMDSLFVSRARLESQLVFEDPCPFQQISCAKNGYTYNRRVCAKLVNKTS